MKKLLFYISTILVVAYVIGSFFWTSAARRDATCSGIVVTVENPNDSIRFITDKFILSEMNRLGFNVKGKRLVNISEEQIERTFNKQYYVEHVQCYTNSDNSLCIDLEPIQPVMRVFDGNQSYYINRAGKHVPANEGFFLDNICRSSTSSPAIPRQTKWFRQSTPPTRATSTSSPRWQESP